MKEEISMSKIIGQILVIILSIVTGILFMSLTVYLFNMEDILDKLLVTFIGTGVSAIIWDKIFLEDH